MQIPPIPAIAHLVRHFLILESPGRGTTIHRLIPDGNPGIVFTYGASFEAFPTSFVYGQVTRPHPIVSTGAVGVFIAVLRPYALYLLTGLPAHTLTDKVLPLQQVWGRDAGVFEERLLKAESDQQRLDLVQRFLLQRQTPLPDPEIVYSLDRLTQQGLEIEALAIELSIRRRTLERMFQTTIGIPPKQFAGILRTQHFLKALHQTESLTQLAYEFGYYDQSHLIRDFKAKTGITPGKYFAARDALALNFIQFAG
jgi:AraC-like DNA-binding protein